VGLHRGLGDGQLDCDLGGGFPAPDMGSDLFLPGGEVLPAVEHPGFGVLVLNGLVEESRGGFLWRAMLAFGNNAQRFKRIYVHREDTFTFHPVFYVAPYNLPGIHNFIL